ncbi:MAG: sulfite exporter TauE/SafE family protein [Coriobacteriia bacterium]|nr:sulfite exporter TauE/SafE family protein [Coriobacteriia bacterium]
MFFFIVALLSAAIGSVTGIGGGLIIRPSLSVLGADIGLASFTSAACVFVMSAVSITTRRVWETNIEFRHLIFLAAGTIVGAFAGAYVLLFLSPVLISVLFIVVMIAIGVLLVLRRYIRPRITTNPFLGAAIGLITGFFSGLFGIGGGPLQMVALMYLFGSKPKDAVLQSLFIAMLASAAALIQYSINGFADFSLLLYVIPGGILGGLIGGVVSKYIKEGTVVVLLFVVIAAVIAGQVYLLATI